MPFRLFGRALRSHPRHDDGIPYRRRHRHRSILSLCLCVSLCLSVSLPFFIRRLKYKVPFPLRTYRYVEDDDDTFQTLQQKREETKRDDE